METNWYLEKSKQIESVRKQIHKERLELDKWYKRKHLFKKITMATLFCLPILLLLKQNLYEQVTDEKARR